MRFSRHSAWDADAGAFCCGIKDIKHSKVVAAAHTLHSAVARAVHARACQLPLTEVRPCLQGGSFHTHPAVIDCTTQAGAALATPGAAAALRVPAGLALCLLATEPASGGAVASAQLTALHSDGSVESDYRLQAGPLAISGMLFRPLQAAQQAPAPRQRTQQMLYSTQWLATSTVTSSAAPAVPLHAGMTVSGRRERLHFPAGMPAASAAAALLASMQSGQLGRSIQLAARSQQPTAVAAAAACAGLLRVAAREVPAASFSTLSLPAAAARQPGTAAQPAADAFGLAANSGVWLTPQLGAAPLSQAHHHPILACTEQGRLILGGTGDIGCLAGLWSLRWALPLFARLCPVPSCSSSS